jgi:hypothetical protein
MTGETVKEDCKNEDLDKILVDICEPGCIVLDEPTFDFEIEVIKRSKAIEIPERNMRRSRYSYQLEKAIRRINEYEKSLKGWVENKEKDEAAKGKARAKMMRLINIYNRVKEKYEIPDLRELIAIEDIKRSIYDMIKTMRGSTESTEKTVYFKTIVRRIIIYSCVKGLFPMITTSNEGEIISIRHVISELEKLSRSGKDRRVTNLCVRGKSCLKRIFREIGAELRDDLLEKIALTSAKYSGIRFDLVMEVLKISFVHDRDEMDVLNELLAKRSI